MRKPMTLVEFCLWVAFGCSLFVFAMTILATVLYSVSDRPDRWNVPPTPSGTAWLAAVVALGAAGIMGQHRDSSRVEHPARPAGQRPARSDSTTS